MKINSPELLKEYLRYIRKLIYNIIRLINNNILFKILSFSGVSAATSKALESNFKETLLSGKGSAKSQQSFSSSSSTKEKLQQYSQKPEQQSSNRSGGVNSPRGDSRSVSPSQSIYQKQQPSIIEVGN